MVLVEWDERTGCSGVRERVEQLLGLWLNPSEHVPFRRTFACEVVDPRRFVSRRDEGEHLLEGRGAYARQRIALGSSVEDPDQFVDGGCCFDAQLESTSFLGGVFGTVDVDPPCLFKWGVGHGCLQCE